jgi:hypothetical protein
MADSTEIQEWKRINTTLLEKERHLTQLLVRYARGAVGADVVDEGKMEVDFLRELADVLFARAFCGRAD